MHITDERLQTQWQLKMHNQLAGLQYKVICKPGTSNSTADALSRNIPVLFCSFLPKTVVEVATTCRILVQHQFALSSGKVAV